MHWELVNHSKEFRQHLALRPQWMLDQYSRNLPPSRQPTLQTVSPSQVTSCALSEKELYKVIVAGYHEAQQEMHVSSWWSFVKFLFSAVYIHNIVPITMGVCVGKFGYSSRSIDFPIASSLLYRSCMMYSLQL